MQRPIENLTVLVLVTALAPRPEAHGATLTTAIKKSLAQKALKGASVGVHIVELTSGKEVYSSNADVPLILASNTKLFTTAAALFHLGHDFRFCTVMLRDGPVDTMGTIHGNLIVQGDGDPNVSGRFYSGRSTAVLEQWAAILKKAGVRRVTGDVVADDRIFDRDYLRLDSNRYVAPVSGLPFNENVVEIVVKPAAAPGQPAVMAAEPETQYVPLEGVIRTHGSRKRDKALFHIVPDTNTVRASGHVYLKAPERRYRIRLNDPSLYFVTVLTETLQRAGIEIQGKPRLPKPGEAYPKATVLAKATSGLDVALPIANKESQNLYAECLFKRAGAKVLGRGSFASGNVAIGKFLQTIGVKSKTYHFADGCGLSRTNVASPRTITTMLRYIARSPAGTLFRSSLALSGTDGTLKRRLTEPAYKGKVQAKTGYIKQVCVLSGYAASKSGTVYVFSILVNGYKVYTRTVKGIQDSICQALVDG